VFGIILKVMNELFNVGDVIYGFCSGYFGRDDYDTKVCVLVNSRYAVFQYLGGEFDGYAAVLNFDERLSSDLIEDWKQDDYDV
jgi:hypothetical protein